MTQTVAPREPYRLSTFTNRFDTVPNHYDFPDFASFADALQRAATQRENKDGPAWCGAEFHDGTTRKNANVARVHVIGIDLDDQPRDEIDNVIEWLGDERIEHCWHTSFSEDPDSEFGRYRIVLPLDRPITPLEHRDLMPRLLAWLGIEELADDNCLDPARMFYTPAAPPWQPQLPNCDYEPGNPLDVAHLLAQPLPPDAKVFEPPHPVPKEDRAEIGQGLRDRWGATLDALCTDIRQRPYPGSCYDLKNNRVFAIAQGAPHIISPSRLRDGVIAALRDRNPRASAEDVTNYDRAIEQVDSAIADGMTTPWWPERTQWPLTDSGNAERIVKRHGAQIRYIGSWNKFAVYDAPKGRWSHEAGRPLVLGLTKAIARSIPVEYIGAPDKVLEKVKDFAKHSESAAGRRAALACLEGESRIHVHHEAFDRDAWLLNVQNATIDLLTGRPLSHDPDHLLTKQAAVTFDASAKCPVFDRFLREVCKGDDELSSYVLRCLGYTLTADVSAHCMFLAYGSGRNGKSTLLNLMHDLLGDYATVGAQHLVLASKHDQHPTAKADLFRVRMVTLTEIEQGRSLAEAEVKELTGGDRVKARRMREDFWHFAPTHKLWLSMNDLPRVRGTDDAIWARIRVIPFDASFLGREDRSLGAKLAAERSGILNRLIAGCLQYKREGLNPPARVLEATREYRDSQEPIGDFFAACGYDVDPVVGTEFGAASVERSRASDYSVERGILWGDYRQWSTTEGSPVFTSSRGLYSALRRYFSEHKSDGRLYFRGLRKRQPW